MNSASTSSGSLWRVENLENSSLTPIHRAKDLASDRSPLLFIHGVEFANAQEAMRDFVNPMLDYLGRDRLRDKAIYVFSWNSLIVPRDLSTMFFAAHPIKRLGLALTQLPKSPKYLADVERRAKDAARTLSPFISEWNSENRVGPTVITHSMGSLVWVEAMKRIIESSSMLARPGIWWSLQPAMPRHSLADKGDYHMVSKLYTGHESAKAMIWYSRMDFILSSLYMFSKPGLALGQWGCPEKKIPHRDVTNLVREAHGMTHLASLRGDFFRRVKNLLPIEASNLGII